MTAMSDAERLRQRSKRMLELASRAYCEKHYDFSRLLIQLAAEVIEHASEMDQAREAPPRQHVASPIERS
jgi:HEPN domain-containing protein